MMFDTNGLPGIRTAYWCNLKSGMVFVDGVRINDAVPDQLQGFPVITASLRDQLMERYQFLRDRSVLIFAPEAGGLSAVEISDRLRGAQEKVAYLNDFRAELLLKRKEVLGAAEADLMALDSSVVRHDSLILDHWASGIRALDSPQGRCSLLRDLGTAVTLSDILTGAAAGKFRFPAAGAFELHLVVDASYSMKASGRDEITRETLLLFDGRIRKLLPQATLRWHAFSDTCAPLSLPFIRYPVARGETHYESFVRRVLHERASGLPVTVILFTDGVPTDVSAACSALRRFARLGIDYTQVVFRISEEGFGAAAQDVDVLDGFRRNESDAFTPLPPEEQAREGQRVRREFSEVAMAAGGNQIILTVDRALGVVAIEAFDRWLGAFSSN